MDDEGNMVIVRLPTVCALPEKSSYVPEKKTSDGSVDAASVAEIEEFLDTFFSLYPAAAESELTYYVKSGVLDVIEKDYVYGGLISPVCIQEEERIRAYVYVKYLDQDAKITRYLQYTLTLEKADETWKIVDAE